MIGLIPLLGIIAIPLGVIALVLGIVGWRRRPERAKLARVSTTLGVVAVVLGVAGVLIVDDAFDDAEKLFNPDPLAASESATVTVDGEGITPATRNETATETATSEPVLSASGTPGPQDDAQAAPSTAATNGQAGADGPLVTVQETGGITYSALGETWGAFAAIVRNHTEQDLFFVEVTYNVIGSDGSPVATESSRIEILPARDSMPNAAITTTDLTAAMPISIEVTAFAQVNNIFATDWVEIPVTVDPAISADSATGLEGQDVGPIGPPTISGTLTNTLDVPIQYSEVLCEIRGPAGELMGVVDTASDTAAPGQTIAWNTIGTGDFEYYRSAGARVESCRALVAVR